MPDLDPEMFDELCPSSLSFIRIGDKWGALIVRCLADGPMRFSELRVPLARITPKVMTQSLRQLEGLGLIYREERQRQVTYALTDMGRSLLQPLSVMCDWVDEHWDELVDANDRALLSA